MQPERKRKQLSVIAPCFNEEENVERLVESVTACFCENDLDGELILVNDGSSDTTQERIERCSERNSNVIGLQHEQNQGITASWETGLRVSHGVYVVTFDADMQYSVSDIIRLYAEMLRTDVDLVQGWRKEYNDSMVRRIFCRGLNFLLNVCFWTHVPDIKSGFVLYKRDVLKEILRDRHKFKFFQHFFFIAAIKRNFTYRQVPVVFNKRCAGKSFIQSSFLFAVRLLPDLWRAIWFYNAKRDFMAEDILD